MEESSCTLQYRFHNNNKQMNRKKKKKKPINFTGEKEWAEENNEEKYYTGESGQVNLLIS